MNTHTQSTVENKVATDHLFSYSIVGSFQVDQHLGDDGLHIATATHRVQQVHSTLTYADVTFRLAQLETSFL